MNFKDTKEQVSRVVDEDVQAMLSDMLNSDIVLVSHVVNRWGVNNFIKGMHNIGTDFGYQLVVPTNGSNEIN